MSAHSARTKPPPGIWGFRAPVCRRSVHETPGKNSGGFVRLPCAGACAVSILFQCCFNTVSILFQYCFNTVSILFQCCFLLFLTICSLQPTGCKLQPAGNPYTLSSKSYTLSSKSYTL